MFWFCYNGHMKYTYEEYLEKAKWGSLYGYPWDNNEIDNSFLMAIVCPKHGEVKMYPKEHLKIGCLKCNNEKYGV